MRVFLALLALVFAIAPVPAVANRYDGVLTLDEAIAQGLARSPLVRRAAAEREVAEAGRVGARVLLPSNPILSATLGARHDRSGSKPAANGVEWGIRLELPIEIAGQRGARRAEVERRIEVARRREGLARSEARARIAAAYVSLQLATEAVENGRQFETLGERLLVSARARVAAGASSDVEVRLAEAELGRLRQQRIEAELLALDATAELRHWLALSASSPLQVVLPAIPPRELGGALPELLEQAYRTRQDLQALLASGAALDAQIVRLRREVAPSPVLMLEAAGQQPGQLYLGSGLGLSLPIFARNQGPLAEARAEVRRLATEIDLQHRQIELDVTTLVEGLRMRRSELEVWERQILPAALASSELVETGWRAGKFDLFRVLQVQREAKEARRRRIEVLGGLSASIQLLRSVGTQ